MEYRRAYLKGASYFFTLVTEKRRPIFNNESNVAVLRESMRHVKQKYPFHIAAMVVLPDHLHCIWILPESDSDYSIRWRLIKTWFSKHCADALKRPPNKARIKKQQQAIWQHRFWEHVIRDETDYQRHIDYIHYNPVKHGYVERVSDWKYSSIHKYIRDGVIPENWGGADITIPDNIGGE